MTNRVLLDNVDHRDVRVAIRYGVAFGDAVNQVLVFPTEFEQVQREYPIVFRRDESGGFYATALLGLDHDENLFLDGDRWQARYVPAIRQRGPFIAAAGPAGADGARIHIDLDDARVGTGESGGESGGEGEPIFLRHGGNAPYLQHIERVLDVVGYGHQGTAPMFAMLAEHDLIRATTINIDLGDGRSYAVEDIHVVAEDRLAALDAAALERLNRAGILRASFMALASLDNINRLVELKQRREAGQ